MKYYYIQDPITKAILDICDYDPRTTGKQDSWVEIDEEDFVIADGYDTRLYFKSYMETEEYKQAERQYHETHDNVVLRRRRNEECFPVINRGKLWYDKLTTQQVQELNDWYDAWLNVTETHVVPDKPKWL